MPQCRFLVSSVFVRSECRVRFGPRFKWVGRPESFKRTSCPHHLTVKKEADGPSLAVGRISELDVAALKKTQHEFF